MFNANLDIEELHTRIEEELFRLRARAKEPDFGIEEIDLLFVSGAYDQLIFLFASVINEIQNGACRTGQRSTTDVRVSDICSLVTFAPGRSKSIRALRAMARINANMTRFAAESTVSSVDGTSILLSGGIPGASSRMREEQRHGWASQHAYGRAAINRTNVMERRRDPSHSK